MDIKKIIVERIEKYPYSLLEDGKVIERPKDYYFKMNRIPYYKEKEILVCGDNIDELKEYYKPIKEDIYKRIEELKSFNDLPTICINQCWSCSRNQRIACKMVKEKER